MSLGFVSSLRNVTLFDLHLVQRPSSKALKFLIYEDDNDRDDEIEIDKKEATRKK